MRIAVGATMRIGMNMHLPDIAGENCPVEHVWHPIVLPGAENEPAGQFVHAELPVGAD